MKHAAALLTLLPALHAGSLISLSSIFHFPIFGLSSEEAKAATFCGAQKTLAFGLPLINTIFDGNMNLAAYCAPLMIMHPLQIVVGSLLVPYLSDHNHKIKQA
jgi:sodium/bile acid cotransporter 7